MSEKQVFLHLEEAGLGSAHAAGQQPLVEGSAKESATVCC